MKTNTTQIVTETISVSSNASYTTQITAEAIYRPSNVQSLFTQLSIETLYILNGHQTNITQYVAETIYPAPVGGVIIVPMNALNINSLMTGGMS